MQRSGVVESLHHAGASAIALRSIVAKVCASKTTNNSNRRHPFNMGKSIDLRIKSTSRINAGFALVKYSVQLGVVAIFACLSLTIVAATDDE
jgi:hypothetical protein